MRLRPRSQDRPSKPLSKDPGLINYHRPLTHSFCTHSPSVSNDPGEGRYRWISVPKRKTSTGEPRPEVTFRKSRSGSPSRHQDHPPVFSTRRRGASKGIPHGSFVLSGPVTKCPRTAYLPSGRDSTYGTPLVQWKWSWYRGPPSSCFIYCLRDSPWRHPCLPGPCFLLYFLFKDVRGGVLPSSYKLLSNSRCLLSNSKQG